MPCDQCGRKPAYSIKHIPTRGGWIELVETQTLCGDCAVTIRDQFEQARAEYEEVQAR